MDDDFRRLPGIFRLAKNVSKHSTHRKPMGAVLVENGTPISVGSNQGKTHPEARHTGLHAEIQALKTSGKDRIKGSTIFVYREKRDGSLGMARPCPDCMSALRSFGVRWIYYTIDAYPYFDVEKIG